MLLALPASPTQLDEETASLIAQLALADLDEMAGDFADQQLAFELQAEALETMLRNFGIDPVRAARQARQQLTQRREIDRAPSPAVNAAPEPSEPSPSSAPRSEASTSHASTSSASPTEKRASTSSRLQAGHTYSSPRASESRSMTNVISDEGNDEVVPVYRYNSSATDPGLRVRYEGMMERDDEEANSRNTISERVYQENYGGDEAYEAEEHPAPVMSERLPPSLDGESEDSLVAPYRFPEDRLWWEPPIETFDNEEELFEGDRPEDADEFEEDVRSGDEGGLLNSPLATTPPLQEAAWHPLSEACEPPPGALYICEGCYDHIWSNESVDAPCGHHFCSECVERLVRSSLTDETLFPLRCCGQPLSDAAVDARIPSTLLAQYQTKRAEYVVAPGDRVYCVNARCSAFLGSGLRSPNQARPSVLSCTACRTATCAQCRQPGHAGRDCVQESTAQFDALVKEKQWQRCPSCGATVDRTDGCPHMVSRTMFALNQQEGL
ncbi:hypothetical protein GGF50DRAFT_131736 [Schizophyllum commune]